MNKRPVQKYLVHVLLLSFIVLLVGGGVALLDQWQQGPVSGHASDDTVVGPPSLPASYVDSIFRRLGSPMVGTGQAVEQASRAQNIDDAFALAVWWTETNDGAAGVGLHDLNPGSVRGSIGYPSASDGYTIYPSYTAAVTYWFGMMKRVYINRGLTTVSAIAHPYVGTSTSNLWAGKVITLMSRYRAEAPPPPAVTATPTVDVTTASANANIVRHAKALAQQDQGVVYPPNVPQNQDARTQSTATGGLSSSTKLFLVLFDLLLALGLGLLAQTMLKRYRGNMKVASLLNGTLQEKLRAGFPQPAAPFRPVADSISGRITEDLAWFTPSTGALAAGNTAFPDSSSNSLFSLEALMDMPTQKYSSAQPTPSTGQLLFNTPVEGYAQYTPYTGQLPFDMPLEDSPYTGQLTFNTPAGDYSRPARLPGPGLPSHAMQRPGTGAPNSLHRTRLLSSRPASSFSSLIEDAITDRLPQFVAADQSSSFATSRQREPELVSVGQPFSFAAMRQQEPELVGAGASGGRANGLLSRYRETQMVGGGQRDF